MGWRRHPSRMSGNIPTESVTLGLIGACINPFIGVVGFLIGGIIGEKAKDREAARRFKEIKDMYHITYFWER